MKQKPRTARNKMMDLLARRDHSEKEIRQKLKKSAFAHEEIEQAIEYGKQHRWLPHSIEQQSLLSEKIALTLHRKKKGILYINSYLKTKGLPPIAVDREIEAEKASALLQLKLKRQKKDLAKLSLFLKARGFDSQTIRAVIKKLSF